MESIWRNDKIGVIHDKEEEMLLTHMGNDVGIENSKEKVRSPNEGLLKSVQDDYSLKHLTSSTQQSIQYNTSREHITGA